MIARLIALTTWFALRLRGLRCATVTIGAWRLRVWRGGNPDGEPWLLLHGMGATSATYLPLLGSLRLDCRIVIPEMSANGGTRGPRAAMGVGPGVEVLTELIEREFGSRRPTVCGVSLGGWIAVKLAIARPDLAERLLLVVPGGYKNQDWQRIERLVHVERPSDIGAMWRALFVHPPWFLRFGRLALYALYRTQTVRQVLEAVREEDAFDDRELARLELPVGLVWGERDALFRVEVGEQMLAALPCATLRVIADAGHGVQWERPAAFLAAVREFRRRFPLRSPAGSAQDRVESRSGGPPWRRPTI